MSSLSPAIAPPDLAAVLSASLDRLVGDFVASYQISAADAATRISEVELRPALVAVRDGAASGEARPRGAADIDALLPQAAPALFAVLAAWPADLAEAAAAWELALTAALARI